MRSHLQKLAYDIFCLLHANRISLVISWIPRALNDKADFYSRIIDFDDWAVDPFWFDFICQRLGVATFDRFADCDNKKCLLFNSKYYSPGSAALDSFTQDWSGHLNWLVPPLHLVIHAIHHLNAGRAVGILVIPLWRSAQFWPIVKGYLLAKPLHVKASINSGNIFIPGRNKQTIFGSIRWSSQTMAILFDFR